MSIYRVCIALHVLAFTLWLGHMFVWSLLIGPALKKLQPPATADMLRERSLYLGGLGWPSLAVLVATGLYLLSVRGIGMAELFSGAAFVGAMGVALALKLLLVSVMVAYQAFYGHKSAPLAIYFNMLAALGVLACSVVLVRGLA
jgi:uncharacterized membrane protein